MTDGIIQEVFRRHFHLQDGNEKNCNRCNLLNLIQQELINEIKNSVEIRTCRHDRATLDITCLIGDNE